MAHEACIPGKLNLTPKEQSGPLPFLLSTAETEGAVNPVKVTCESVCAEAAHASLSDKAIREVVDGITLEQLARFSAPTAYDADTHYIDLSNPQLTAQYLLVVDALNFCFWPAPGLEYEHLAGGIKTTLIADPTALDADKLAWIDGAGVRDLMRWTKELPQQEERARLLREVGSALLTHFDGQALKLVQAAGGSAIRLMNLVAQYLPGFRDQAIYKGRQVFFYKRAQIFVGDVYGAFQGSGAGAFWDIDQLTMFADYRVPVVLQQLGVLAYTPALQGKIARREQIPAGSEEEVEIRAMTVEAVERLRQAIAHKFLGTSGATLPHAIQLDWWLWEMGERQRDTAPPHHRTLTIFY